ncbi:Rieske 2Fe-2S domain-containing protein [Cryomorphaceae bacterium]|nr:Rieske 2Fe-2S domain-containing protein [Cryomorphaceae bacterium]
MKHEDLDWIAFSPETQAELARHSEEGFMIIVQQKRVGDIVLTYHNDRWHAMKNRCPHQGFSFVGGRITPAGEIECPIHKYRFNLNDGKEKSQTCPSVPIYPIREEEGRYEIGIKKSIWSFLRF